MGATTPSTATSVADSPTAAIFAMSDSSPTWNSRNSTPIWANASTVGTDFSASRP